MKAYSLDLRKRVVEFVKASHSRHEAARHFGVSVSFVVNLARRYHLTGNYAPKAEGGWRYSKIDPHRDFVLSRIADKPDITMPELARELAAKETNVAPASLSRWLRRNGYRFKKNAAGIGTRSPGRSRRTHRMDRKTSAKDGRAGTPSGLCR